MQCMNGISRIHKISKFATFHLCWSLCDLFMQVYHSVKRWAIVHRSSVRPRMTHEKGKRLANSSQAPCVTFYHRLHSSSSSSRCTKSYAPVLRMTLKQVAIYKSLLLFHNLPVWPVALCTVCRPTTVLGGTSILLQSFADCWFFAEWRPSRPPLSSSSFHLSVVWDTLKMRKYLSFPLHDWCKQLDGWTWQWRHVFTGTQGSSL